MNRTYTLTLINSAGRVLDTKVIKTHSLSRLGDLIADGDGDDWDLADGDTIKVEVQS